MPKSIRSIGLLICTAIVLVVGPSTQSPAAEDVALPSLKIGNVSVLEGSSGTVAMTFTVTLSAASSWPATVDVATADGTATAPTDYVALLPTTLTFGPGETTKTVVVSVNGDVVREPNETLFVNLTEPVGATVAVSRGIGTIRNDD